MQPFFQPLPIGRFEALDEVFRALQVQRRGVFVPTITPHVQPVVLVSGHEHHERFGRMVLVAAGGGNSRLQVFNHIGSGMTVYVDAVFWRNANAVSIFGTLTSFATAVGALNPHIVGNLASSVLLRSDNAGGLPGDATIFQMLQGTSATIIQELRYPHPITLQEGRGFAIGIEAAAVALTAGFEIRQVPTPPIPL